MGLGIGISGPNGDSGGGTPTSDSAKILKTGQTVSYRTGDDGDIEAGREVDTETLPDDNPFGNTNRFTDELGGQTYTNDIIIDWSTYDGSEVLGIYRNFGAAKTWNDAIDDALTLSVDGFTGWRLANIRELDYFAIRTTLTVFNYPPINSIFQHWSSSVYVVSPTTIAWAISSAGVSNATIMTAGSRRTFEVKDFTNAELGI